MNVSLKKKFDSYTLFVFHIQFGYHWPLVNTITPHQEALKVVAPKESTKIYKSHLWVDPTHEEEGGGRFKLVEKQNPNSSNKTTKNLRQRRSKSHNT
jgi:hypothetical protein